MSYENQMFLGVPELVSRKLTVKGMTNTQESSLIFGYLEKALKFNVGLLNRGLQDSAS